MISLPCMVGWNVQALWDTPDAAHDVAPRLPLPQLSRIPFRRALSGRCVWNDITIDPDHRVRYGHGENRGVEFHPADLDGVRPWWCC